MTKTILIVDDDVSLTEILYAFFTHEGYKVTTTNTPLEILDIVKIIKPDIIIMDVMMPKVNGARVAKCLKAEASTENIPILFLTGLLSEGEEDLEEYGISSEGCNYSVVAKPFDNHKLLEKVEKILNE